MRQRWWPRTRRILLYVSLGGWLGMLATPSQSAAALVNLHDFFADPTVLLAPDGTSAVLTEDPVTGFVLLSNDPGLGDPQVVQPGVGVSLVFDYAFTIGSLANNDEFGAFLINAQTGSSLGPGGQFFTQTTGTGTVAFDLSTLTGTSLGLQFQLSALPGDQELDSTVTITQVRLETVTATVPEPSASLCLAMALLGLVGQQWWARVRHARASRP